MSTTTVPDPFAVALELAKRREAQEAQQAAEKRAADAEKRAALIAERESQAFREAMRQWGQNFLAAVANKATKRGWKLGAILDARAYAMTLLRLSDDVVAPNIDPSIARVVQETFAYGVVLNHRGREIQIPEGTFFGQRQDWFPPFYEKAASAR